MLEADPLFQHPENDSEEGKTADAAFGEKEQSSKSIAAQQKHHSTAFRSEVWRRCSSASFGSTKTLYDAKSLRQMATSGTDGAQDKEEAEKEQEKVETEKPEEKVSSGFFANFFFHPTPSSTDDKEEGDGNDNDNAEKETAAEETYTILGTSVEDEDCHPHVLSPPIMEALRPHLPFTVRQDNYWLKYSMVRDVSWVPTTILLFFDSQHYHQQQQMSLVCFRCTNVFFCSFPFFDMILLSTSPPPPTASLSIPPGRIHESHAEQDPLVGSYYSGDRNL